MGFFEDRVKVLNKDFESKRMILILGDSGTGKTYQFRTLVEAGLKCLYVSTEMKQSSISDLDVETFHVKTFDFPETPKEKAALLRTKQSDVMELFDALRTEEHGYDVVYFDSIMRYASKMFDYLKSKVVAQSGEADTRKAYLIFGNKMGAFLETLGELSNGGTAKQPVHFVGTWGVEIGQDWQGRRQIQPIVDGKMTGPTINYAFDEVLMMGCNENPATGEQTFEMYTMGNKEFSAKKSAPPGLNIPPKLVNPNLADLIKVLEKEEKATILKNRK